MANERGGLLADRLFATFVAPLVLGGRMPLGRPIGFRRAFSMSDDERPVDPDRWTNVGLARVRVARRFVPVDSLATLSAAEWALCAALHDIVQASHPALAHSSRGKRARLVLELATKTLRHLPDCAHAGQALARHTLFSRMLEITRTTTKVSWWTGSATFVGEDPPQRLLAWPGMRRVHVHADPARLERLLTETPLAADAEPALRLFFLHTPLTDWSTALRAWPAFCFTPQNLGLASTTMGRTLVLRGLRALPQDPLDAVVGRALSQLTRGGQPSGALRAALDLFGAHVLEESLHALSTPEDKRRSLSVSSDPNAALAQAAGALAAREYLAVHGDAFTEVERRWILHHLTPHTKGAAAEMLQAMWPPLAA